MFGFPSTEILTYIGIKSISRLVMKLSRESDPASNKTPISKQLN